MKKEWIDYLSRNEILRTLCKWRADIVRKRSPHHRLWAIAKGLVAPKVAYPDNVSVYLPTRRRWIRIGAKGRTRIGESRLIETTIFRTALRDLALPNDLPDKPKWTAAFTELMREVNVLRCAAHVKFQLPTIHLVQKAKGCERRCLASFDHVADRILLSKAALYLRDLFDPYLSDDCFAFRRDGKYNYRSAIEDMVQYRTKHANDKIYVAECDIRSFFDVVNQRTVLDAYDSFVGRVSEACRPSEELRNILVGYLESYTSRGNLMASQDPKIVALRHLVKPLKDTGVYKFYKNKTERAAIRLGIPQGGALSPVLANLVLDAADKAVRSGDDPDLFYIRFCDDVIFMHPKRRKCKAAIDRYIVALKSLKLPIHPVVPKVSFGSSYYDDKSKGPFLWGMPSVRVKNAAPWVSFLGVHVRYDGIIRVRKDSIKRHEKKLTCEAKLVKRVVGVDGVNLKDTSDESKEALLRAFESRIVAMGTGYSTMRFPRIGCRCWMAAFHGLTPDGPAAGQMHHLDSVRGHLVSLVKMQLGLKKGTLPSGRKGYFGRPYSYYGALLDVERHKSYPADPNAYSRW